MLLLILFLSLVSLVATGYMERHLRSIVDEHYAKAELMITMRNTAKNRSMSLLRMLLLSNRFERSAAMDEFERNLTLFKKAQSRLLSMPLTAEERRVLSAEHDISQTAVETQSRVAALLMQDQVVLATQLMYNEAMPKSQEAGNKLEELIQLQRTASNAEKDRARLAFSQAISLIVLLGGSAMLVGMLVAFIVVRRSLHSEASLFRAKERAQVTLDSIAEGVITTNADGKVEYMNAVAEELTQHNFKNSSGKDLLDIFQVKSEEDGTRLPKDFIQQIIEEDKPSDNKIPMLLQDALGEHHAIEYTVAPIKDYDASVSGTVVVFKDVTAIRNMIERMAFQATHDPLTGLLNRSEFEKQLTSAILSARQQQAKHVMCYIDLDQFKVVNDNCGHIAGDEFLKQLSDVLRQNVRRTDVLARLGGDEFGVLLQNCKLTKAVQIVDELRQAVNVSRFAWKDKSFEISASFGIVEITHDSGGLTEVLSAADTACFVAKDLGRNRAHIYQPDDLALAKRRDEMHWLPRIRKALAKGDIKLYQQRIMPLKKHLSHNFYEIIIRLHEDDGNVVPPKAFIPSAERYDLMPQLDRYVVQKAMEYISRYCEEHPQKNALWSINLSGQTLCEASFYEFVEQSAREYEVKPEMLCFEVTETAAVANLTSAGSMIRQLKQQGFKFALDDFGSGLSSFTYLKKLPVDYLKIDGSFVRDIARDPIDRAMVKSIYQISRVMGLHTIAEYVEDAKALQCLKDIGIEFAQGNWLHEAESMQITALAIANP